LTCMAAMVLGDLRFPALAPYSVPEQKSANGEAFSERTRLRPGEKRGAMLLQVTECDSFVE
jgi:hypothetical protein